MLIKLKINKSDLQVTSDDPELVVVSAKESNEFIELEVSKPDPEIMTPYGNYNINN
jgi:hypothetical protein